MFFMYILVLNTLTTYNTTSHTTYYRLVAISTNRDWFMYTYNTKVLLVYKHKKCETEQFFVGSLDEFIRRTGTYTHTKTNLELQVVYDTNGINNMMMNTSGYKPIPSSLDTIHARDIFLSVLCDPGAVIVAPKEGESIPIINAIFPPP